MISDLNLKIVPLIYYLSYAHFRFTNSDITKAPRTNPVRETENSVFEPTDWVRTVFSNRIRVSLHENFWLLSAYFNLLSHLATTEEYTINRGATQSISQKAPHPGC
jgi:hypothetical protein